MKKTLEVFKLENVGRKDKNPYYRAKAQIQTNVNPCSNKNFETYKRQKRNPRKLKSESKDSNCLIFS